MPIEAKVREMASAHLTSGHATYVWRAGEDRIEWSPELCALYGV
jgi:hypothetical protein